MYSQDFAQMHGFPCVLGCIDGTHIGIQAPVEEEKNFVNRKGFHSLNVMVKNKRLFPKIKFPKNGNVVGKLNVKPIS